MGTSNTTTKRYRNDLNMDIFLTDKNWKKKEFTRLYVYKKWKWYSERKYTW